MRCNQCPRECNIDRTKAQGYCRVGDSFRIAKAALHHWEEPIISGSEGSGTIFFSGCNLGCNYCQNYEISRHCRGEEYTQSEFIDAIKRLEGEGAHNINLVTPSHYANQIMRAIDKYRPQIPICYNTSSYDSISVVNQLNDYVDIYLADLKYLGREIASEYSNAADYPDIATKAILAMREKTDIVEDGIMRQGLIVRHLVLPNRSEQSLAVIEWIKNNLSHNCFISVMSQYTPIEGLKEEQARVLKPLEYKIVTKAIVSAGYQNVYIQQLESADGQYIPNWSGERLDTSKNIRTLIRRGL